MSWRRELTLVGYNPRILLSVSRYIVSEASERTFQRSSAPLGPGGVAFLRPVAIAKSSRKRYHSRYNLRPKMVKTSSWKSSGPFVGPKVNPLGKYVPLATKTAIFLADSGSFSTWLNPSLASPTEMNLLPDTQLFI